MTKTKKIVGISLAALAALIILTVLFVFQKPQQSPQPVITIDGKQAEYATVKNKWNGTVYNQLDSFNLLLKKDTFQKIMEKHTESNISYAEVGKTVLIDFQNAPPDKLTVQDKIIDKNGNPMLDDKVTMAVQSEQKGAYSFKVKKKAVSKFSSAPYATNLRGIRITAIWGENECEYAFVMKTGEDNALLQPPKPTIKIGNKQIEYLTAKNQWNGTAYDRADTFQTIMKQHTESEIPYTEIGKTISVDFQNTSPDKLTVQDMIVNKIGKQMYNDKETMTVQTEQKINVYTFKIQKNFASGLRSIKHDTDLRGIRITCGWGENECEYAFIIRTDAF